MPTLHPMPEGTRGFCTIDPALFMDGPNPAVADKADMDLVIGTSVNGNKAVLDPGLTVLIGPPGSGKSYTANRLSANSVEAGFNTQHLMFGEFESDAFGSILDLGAMIEKSAHDQGLPDVLIVDSIKSFVYRAVGAAGQRGMSSSLGEDLGNLAVQARRSGVRLIAILNPASSDQQLIEQLLEALKTNATHVLLLDRDHTVRFTNRTGNRELTTVRLWQPDGSGAGAPIQSELVLSGQMSALRSVVVDDSEVRAATGQSSQVIEDDFSIVDPSPRATNRSLPGQYSEDKATGVTAPNTTLFDQIK